MRASRLLIASALAMLVVNSSVGQVGGASSSSSVAFSLGISIVPPVLPADGRIHGVVVVSLLDGNGKQTVALNNTLVYLTSSKEDVAAVQGAVAIPAGRSYVVANVTNTLTPGRTVMTASSVGLGSAYGELKTMIPSGFPTSLAVFSSPPFQPLGQSTGQIVVEILDQLGRPTRAAFPTPVLLSSSGNTILRPTISNFTVPVNQTVVAVGYTSDPYGPAPGTATITASASGFNSGYTQVTVSNRTAGPPSRLSLIPNPAQLIADGRSYRALTVMLDDNNGSATIAPPLSGGIYVQLTSSLPSVLSVPPVALIPPGKGYVLVNATASVSPGSSTITATSAGLASASAVVSAVAPAPSKLALYVAPTRAVVTSLGSRALLYVQLQDGDGNPALGRRATNVVITSSNSTLAENAIKLTIPRGEDYSVASLALDGSSEGTLTASSSGLGSANATLRSFLAPLQASLAAATSSIYENQTVLVTLTAYALGLPLRGATVTWNSTGGTVEGGAKQTDASGRATATFRPASPGSVLIGATVNSKALGSANLTAPVFVMPVPVRHQQSLLERILSYWVYLVATAVGAILVVFAVRRKRRHAETAEEGLEFGS